MIARASTWRAGEVQAAVGGELYGSPDRILRGVCTDTRDALEAQLFVALSGTRYDAHDFLKEALKRGASGLLVTRCGYARVRADLPDHQSSCSVIEVEDSTWALGELARAYRRRMGTPVLAITGSNGKTSTKEMLSSILAESRTVLKTEGNLNNLIGVPLTLLGLSDRHQLAVVEMGMNEPGEIARYCEIAEPRMGLVLNVAPAHIGNFGSLDAIAQAKGELYRGLDKSDGLAVVNADDERVVKAARESGVERVRTFGLTQEADVQLLRRALVDKGGAQQIWFAVDGEEATTTVPMGAQSSALNAIAAIAAATCRLQGEVLAGVADVISGLPKTTVGAGRLNVEILGDYILINDCYNANSSSMASAFEFAKEYAERNGGRFVALLGEMGELGSFCESEHRRVGADLVKAGAKVVASFGPGARPISDRVQEDGVTTEHEKKSVERLLSWLVSALKKGDVVLVKGSRSCRMERFIEPLRVRLS